jgi:hypothetical protein
MGSSEMDIQRIIAHAFLTILKPDEGLRNATRAFALRFDGADNVT